MATMKQLAIGIIILFVFSGSASASGFGVFTQGASALGQANAVTAQPNGPSSVYFNPALLNDVPGVQFEVGTTGVYADRAIQLDSGDSATGDNSWNFPSTFYYSHQINDQLSAGFAAFFPFGLSNSWDEDYEGRYLGTSGDIFTLNLNPVISWKATPRLSIAAGVSALYMDADLRKKINQTAAYDITDLQLSGGMGGALPPRGGPLPDIDQKFTGDGWGYGFNLGLYLKAHDRVHVGMTYRSHIDIDIKGKAVFSQVDPILAAAFADTKGEAGIRLPAQATAGIAFIVTDTFTTEAGVRWEDWSSTNNLTIYLDQPVFGQSSEIIPRDWRATWSYNIGANLQATPSIALKAGYLYGQNAVPSSTFEPLIPDTDAHLFTLGAQWSQDRWTLACAFGYEYHQTGNKRNDLRDELGSAVAGTSVGTANGAYDTDIYLVGTSVGYRF